MSRFKTELCNNLIELGTCKYGDRCHYAHGAHELRQVSRRHPKYRTEKCKNFELTGKCPFGPRCSYVHPKPDLDSMIEQLSKYMRHTKAPKPDSEDDEDIGLVFSRTSTSSSTCDSVLTNNDEENKENQRFNYKLSCPTRNSSGTVSNSSSLQTISYTDSFPSTLTSDPVIQKPSRLLKNNPHHLMTNLSSSSLSATPFNASCSNSNVSLQATSSSFVRTPLADTSNNHSNNIIISTPMNLTNNSHQANDLISGIKTFNSGAAINTKNPSLTPEVTSYETSKNLRLINTEPHIGSTKTTSNPFGISNPLSDLLNNTSFNGSRSPLIPNKQFYTRF